VLSASRGRDGERACQFLLDALHCASANTDLAGDLENALSGAQLSLDALFDSRADSRPTECFARLYGPLKASIDSLADHAALKFGRCTFISHPKAATVDEIIDFVVEQSTHSPEGNPTAISALRVRGGQWAN